MPTCFVIMPITTPPHLVERYKGDEEHFGHVLEYLFTPALEQAGYDAVSPVASGSDLIQAEIIRNLDEADLALCDMTALNANVFFELGIRTALNRPVASVRDTFTERIPFDHSMVNCHEYRWEMDAWVVREEIPRLAAHVRACVERGGETNTLWKRLGIEATAQVGSAGTTDDDKLDHLVRQIEDLRAEVRRDEVRQDEIRRVWFPADGTDPDPLTPVIIDTYFGDTFAVTPAVSMAGLAEELGVDIDELSALARRLGVHLGRDGMIDGAASDRVRRTAKRELSGR